MTRAAIVVLDSLGIGGAPDAARFGDAGADTLGNIARRCADGSVQRSDGRTGALVLPHLAALGLGRAALLASGREPPGLGHDDRALALWGAAAEVSAGKDTPSGHWEIAGLPVTEPWGYFPRREPCFPPDLVASLISEAGLPGILGNCHASGTDIIARLGARHTETGMPICYTSADSVFQIAAHELTFGLERLYAVSEIARRLVDPLRIGRVIARPFVGDPATGFRRTGNRRDYARPPPAPTLLDALASAGREVVSIGKVGDIFGHRSTGREVPAHGNQAVVDATIASLASLDEGGLVFANLVDFDTLYGHRRDVAGYAAALEDFDRRLPAIVAALRFGDLVVVTADHGCDPTAPGTDHTRELVPILAFGPGLPSGPIGLRDGFADIAATVVQHLGITWSGAGRSFLPAEAELGEPDALS